MRTSFQDTSRLYDHLRLGKMVDQRLREASAHGHQAAPVFVDAAEMPGARQISGQYRADGDKIAVTVVVVRDGHELRRFEASGNKAELPRLVDEIVRRASDQLHE